MNFRLMHWPSYSEDEWWRQWASQTASELSLLSGWRDRTDQWRDLLHERLEELLGWEQPPTEPQVELLGRKDVQGFSVQKVALSADDGTRIPGYVCVPHDNQQPLPAVVLSHDGAVSKEAMVGLLTESNPDAAPGAHLAASGYVVCCMDVRGEGERPHSSETEAMWQWLGKPAVGRDAADLVVARRMLAARPDVLDRRIGILGIGSGAMAALYAAIMDSDFSATALCGCLIRYRAVPLVGDSRRRAGLCERVAHDVLPGLLAHADFEDLASMIAPRPLCLCQGAERDLPQELAADAAARVAQGFELMGEKSKLTVELVDGLVQYPSPGVLSFLDDWLKLPVSPAESSPSG